MHACAIDGALFVTFTPPSPAPLVIDAPFRPLPDFPTAGWNYVIPLLRATDDIALATLRQTIARYRPGSDVIALACEPQAALAPSADARRALRTQLSADTGCTVIEPVGAADLGDVVRIFTDFFRADGPIGFDPSYFPFRTPASPGLPTATLHRTAIGEAIDSCDAAAMIAVVALDSDRPLSDYNDIYAHYTRALSSDADFWLIARLVRRRADEVARVLVLER